MPKRLVLPQELPSIQGAIINTLDGGDDVGWREVQRLVASYKVLDQKYRLALWAGHGCQGLALYQEGEELQCGNVDRHGFLDFQRMPIEDLEDQLCKMKLTESGVVIPGLNDGQLIPGANL